MKLAALHFPALGEVPAGFSGEHEDDTVVKVEGLFKVNTTVIELYCPLKCVVAGSPTLDETNLNATVREGRVWLPKQHHRLESPRSRGVGTPGETEPLATSLRGLWVSGLLSPGNGGHERRGGDPEPTK